MKKATTMKDIAVAAGVSLTTVSYVLNNSSKQKISHEMRLKIIELAKQMHYIPNLTAKSLAGRRSYLIGVIAITGNNTLKSRLYCYYDLVSEITKQAKQIGYDVVSIFIDDFDTEIDKISKRNFDGIFIIDVPPTRVYEITNHFYVPIVFLDSIVDDQLFRSVISDYDNVFLEARHTFHHANLFLVMDDFNNLLLKEKIFANFLPENVFIQTANSSLATFLNEKSNMCGVVIGEVLGIKMEAIFNKSQFLVIVPTSKTTILDADTKRIVLSNKNKVKQGITILKSRMDLNFGDIPQQVLIAPMGDCE